VLKGTAAVVTAVAGLLGALYQFRGGAATERSAHEVSVAVPATTAVVTTTAPATTVARTQPTRSVDTARRREVVANRSYVEGLDLLLLNSSDTRGVLNEVLTGVQRGALGRANAVSRIEDVIDDRRALLDHITTRPTPQAFRAAQRALRAAIALSIKVDLAALNYVEASFNGNVVARDNAYREIAAGSRQATAQKASFTRLYNAARARSGLGVFAGSF
jgi:hypothetical protein